MKRADLSKQVIDNLCQDKCWRLDIDLGFDGMHEFSIVWQHFIAFPEEISPFFEPTPRIINARFQALKLAV